MTSIGRGFLAVVPPEEVLDVLEARIAIGREQEPTLKWVRREQLHITLQFLGRVNYADALIDIVRPVVASTPRFTMQLVGAGAFPKPRRASVVWIGVGEGDEHVVDLARAGSSATAPIGFETESRQFHPHVTLARVPRLRPVDELLTALGDDAVGPPFVVNEVVLFESQTRREGAVYTERARLELDDGR